MALALIIFSKCTIRKVVFFIILNIKSYEFILDAEQYETAKDLDWKITKSSSSVSPFIIIDGHHKCMAKVLFNLASDISVFHKNGNSLDYRKENLIFCNKNQLAYLASNCQKKQNKSSNYYSVYFRTDHNMWTATLRYNSKNISYGFSDEKEAAIAADYLARVYYGEAAMLNFPELSFDQVKEAFFELQLKYGFTKGERITKSQQGIPKKRKTKQLSKYVGVSKDKNRWRAYISFKGKKIQIGSFRDELSAAEAYDKKAKELYGKDANLNFE